VYEPPDQGDHHREALGWPAARGSAPNRPGGPGGRSGHREAGRARPADQASASAAETHVRYLARRCAGHLTTTRRHGHAAIDRDIAQVQSTHPVVGIQHEGDPGWRPRSVRPVAGVASSPRPSRQQASVRYSRRRTPARAWQTTSRSETRGRWHPKGCETTRSDTSAENWSKTRSMIHGGMAGRGASPHTESLSTFPHDRAPRALPSPRFRSTF
jgi:hypothetical protein